jgi:GntR family transcriptional repressor for pyruvate dehydrogenase complex
LLNSESCQKVVEKFVQSLRDGSLKPDDKIYSENQLARILGVPRAQVREVYTALSVLGILYGQQGKGTFLGSGNIRQNTEVLYLMTLFTNPNYRDILAVRCILELGAAPAAAANRSDEDLAELRRYARQMAESTDLDTLSQADYAFHERLMQSAGNALLHCLFQIVSGHTEHLLALRWNRSPAEMHLQRIREHLSMVDALERRDSEALIELLKSHFEDLEQVVDG